MRLPTKINPDSIRDSIIEIKYSSSLPFEVMVGYIFNALDDTYKYTNRPAPFTKDEQEVFQRAALELQMGPQNIFFTDTIKLDLRPNSLVFNCLDKYKGWAVYKAEIVKTLRQISTIKEIQKYTRVGLRYVSEYPETDIASCTKFKFSFGIPSIVSDTYAFRSEFSVDNYTVILALQHKAQMITGIMKDGGAETKPISIIDIDIIAKNLSINIVDELFSFLDKIHEKEKEIFFSLLDENYLKKLNPVYE
jgi:uncharacterized protein (TIGR04255 family)